MPAWKEAERRVAKFLGAFRTPLSGSNSHLTSGDIVHPTIYAEVKYRKRFAVLTQMGQVRKLAAKEGKVPIMVLQQAGHKRRYYVVAEQDLLKLLEAVNENQS